jgi:hypothetical protein
MHLFFGESNIYHNLLKKVAHNLLMKKLNVFGFEQPQDISGLIQDIGGLV